MQAEVLLSKLAPTQAPRPLRFWYQYFLHALCSASRLLPSFADAASCRPVVQTWTWGEPWGEFSMKVDRSPRLVEGAHDIAKIACGAFHNLLLSRSVADAQQKAGSLRTLHLEGCHSCLSSAGLPCACFNPSGLQVACSFSLQLTL